MAATCPNHTDHSAARDGSSIELLVSGMNCQGCVRHVTEALQKVSGVARADVFLEAGRASVRWQPDAEKNASTLVQAVESAGYKAKLVENTAEKPVEKKWSPLAGWRFNVVIGLIATVPLLVGEWIFHLGMHTWFHWLAFVVALPVQIFCGARFYRGAWNQIKVGGSNMDTLVALGSTTAFVYSTWALFSGAGGEVYFMEAAAIITLISLGHWMEARASSRAASALRALLHLAPQTARKKNSDGSESEIAVADLRENDLVALRPGDRVPTDGELSEGQTSVDESMLTGESLPVEKQIGNTLYAGTNNLNGQIVMRVTATGEATALAHIIGAVQRAQSSRADIQRLADRVSSVFVPIVVTIALAAGLWWGFAPAQAHDVSEFLQRYLWPAAVPATTLAAAIFISAAILIVACPCAMGLATPIAIMAGTNAAARRGILIRDGIALERAGKITAVVFDKTGTLTRGKPVVADSKILSAEGKFDPLKIAAALARGSNHPLSQAVARMASADESGKKLSVAQVSKPAVSAIWNPMAQQTWKSALRPKDFLATPLNEFPLRQWEEVRGAGVQAKMSLEDGGEVLLRLGSMSWMKKSGVNDGEAAEFCEQWMNRGATILGLSADEKLVVVIALQDTLKPGAEEVVREIKNRSLKVFLITGDNSRTAKAIAEQAGITLENVFAEIRPEQKAELVQRLQKRGERVAFVGDGINDAPALEQADLGIAVSEASDVASEAADIILLKSEIQAIPEAIELARATLRTIKQNLFWAFFYNAAAVPLAAFGFLSPILCAAAMGLSDLVVIGNALRLRVSSRRGVSSTRSVSSNLSAAS